MEELLAQFRDNPDAAQTWSAAERRGMLRFLVLAAQARMSPELISRLSPGVAAELGFRKAISVSDEELRRRPGRPRGSAASELEQYDFDVEHFQALRDAGASDVPRNKEVFYELAERSGKSPNTLKVALRRERKRHRP